MRLFITGGAGFIGSNFIRQTLAARPGYHIVNFDRLTYAGNLSNLRDVEADPRYSFVRGDICDRAAVDEAIRGADAVINYATEKFADVILKSTGDRGVDLILDAVGKPTFEEGLRCLAPFGNIVLYGRAGGAPDPLNLSVLSPKSQKVSALSLPTLTRNFPDKTLESAQRCFALMREGRLKLYISRTYPLAQAAEAHRHLESRESTGKLILLP